MQLFSVPEGRGKTGFKKAKKQPWYFSRNSRFQVKKSVRTCAAPLPAPKNTSASVQQPFPTQKAVPHRCSARLYNNLLKLHWWLFKAFTRQVVRQCCVLAAGRS
jgi:hypothetical protein